MSYTEKFFLTDLVANYTEHHPKEKYYYYKKNAIYQIYKKHMTGKGRLLELGCSVGLSTTHLAKDVDEIVCVEAVEEFINISKKSTKQYDNVTFVNMLFEDMMFNSEFDYVVADYVLEHVEDVDSIFERCHCALKVNGLLFATVPNAQAFSRQMAVKMGLMKSIYDLTENDHRFGHRRTFDKDTFEELFKKNNYEIIVSEGSFFKPFADFQLEEMLNLNIIGESQFEGLIKMGKKYPTLCDSLCIIAKKL